MEEIPIRKQCSTAAVIIHHDKVLLLKRAKKSRWSTWEVPGGKCSRNDGNTVTCLMREVKEETNLEVKPNKYLGAIMYQVGKQEHPQHGYLCSLISAVSQLHLNAEEHTESRWVNKKEVNALVDDKELAGQILEAM